MKTTTVARGFIGAVASLLGVVAVGCSAGMMDEGAAGEGEIGSVEQALTVNATLVASYPATEHEWAASCKVTIGGVEKMVSYGGYNTSGVAIDETRIYTPGTPGSWATFDAITDTLLAGANDARFDNQARGEAQFLKLSATECLLVGGLSQKTSGAVRARTFIFDPTQASGSQWRLAGDLNAGRAKFGLSKCGTSEAIVFGGHSAAVNSPITGANDVEYWTGSAWQAASVSGLLSPGRHSGMFAAKDSTKFVLAGGHNGSSPQSIVEAFTANSACDTITKLGTSANLRNPANTANSLGRYAGVALFDSASNDLYVGLGEDPNGVLLDDVQKFGVNFSTGVTFTSQPITGIATASLVRYPSVAEVAAGHLVIAGGELNNDADPLESTPTDMVQDFKIVSGTPSLPATTTGVLSSGRLGGAMQSLANGKVYISSGMEAQTNDLTQVTEEITP